MLCKNNKTPAQIVCELLQAYSNGEVDKASAMLAEDFKRFGDPDMTIPWNKQQYHNMWVGFCGSFPDFKFDLTNYIESGNTVAVEMIESGTFTKPFTAVAGPPVEPSNKFYKDWDCAWYVVNDDGLITEVRAYLTNNFGKTHSLIGHVDKTTNIADAFG